MQGIPADPAAFVRLIREIFPPAAFAGVVIRALTPPQSPPVTLTYLHDAISPVELERLVLTPLAAGWLTGTPEQIALSGRFPAPLVQAVTESRLLQQALFAGCAVLHLAGQESALLVGGVERRSRQPDRFEQDLSANLGILVRLLAEPDVRIERSLTPAGEEAALLYLASKASPELVRRVKAWSQSPQTDTERPALWQRLVSPFRLPETLEVSSPLVAANALRTGHVALMTSIDPAPRLAPTTLKRLFAAPNAPTQSKTIRQISLWSRIPMVAWGVAGGALLVAVAEYHHALIPGPFLMALAASRQNMPFPIVLELFLLEVLADLTRAGAVRTGGSKAVATATVAILLEILIMVEVGVVSAISGVVCFSTVVAREALPAPALRESARIWRYLFVAAATGLGVYGMTLAIYLSLVYLGQERAFGHPVHRPLEEGQP